MEQGFSMEFSGKNATCPSYLPPFDYSESSNQENYIIPAESVSGLDFEFTNTTSDVSHIFNLKESSGKDTYALFDPNFDWMSLTTETDHVYTPSSIFRNLIEGQYHETASQAAKNEIDLNMTSVVHIEIEISDETETEECTSSTTETPTTLSDLYKTISINDLRDYELDSLSTGSDEVHEPNMNMEPLPSDFALEKNDVVDKSFPGILGDETVPSFGAFDKFQNIPPSLSRERRSSQSRGRARRSGSFTNVHRSSRRSTPPRYWKATVPGCDRSEIKTRRRSDATSSVSSCPYNRPFIPSRPEHFRTITISVDEAYLGPSTSWGRIKDLPIWMRPSRLDYLSDSD
ncbi:uncharacterized protein LOC108738208 [Agrilus planipennis]|uniref:Uncharacterized protein LOC108738208 n=1 Tax=Agrilus planipennis TaxID=224129 RepID=A0A7F5RFY0_AGRPL|nr:uncharacterized protein LOC108738208 [Agrilus planipennis]